MITSPVFMMHVPELFSQVLWENRFEEAWARAWAATAYTERVELARCTRKGVRVTPTERWNAYNSARMAASDGARMATLVAALNAPHLGAIREKADQALERFAWSAAEDAHQALEEGVN